MPDAARKLAHSVPILRVNNLAVSLAYYTNTLGFKVDWDYGGFASVSRDRCSLFLCEGGQGHAGTWIWVAVDDSDLLFEEWKASGAHIRQPPTNFPWGSRELQLQDPDGHVLRFGSDNKAGEPFGEFLPDRTAF